MSKDYIGRFVKKFESGSRGSLSIGQSGIDWGCSYGTYQFIIRYGNVIKFLKEYFPEEASGLYWNNLDDRPLNYYPGAAYCSSPDEITNVWLRAYNKVGPDKFFACEHDRIEKGWYIPSKNYIKNKLGIDVDQVSRAYQEMVWSGAVHFGGISFAEMFIQAVVEIGNFAANQGAIFDRIYQLRFEKMKEAYPNPGDRYRAGVFNGNSEVETLRPYLTHSPFSTQTVEPKEKRELLIICGHGEGDTGIVGNPHRECDLTRDLGQRLFDYCKSMGRKVDLYDPNKNMYYHLRNGGTVDFSNYNLVLEIHFNGKSNIHSNTFDGKESGTMLYVKDGRVDKTQEFRLLENLVAVGSSQAWNGILPASINFDGGLLIQNTVEGQGVHHIYLETLFVTNNDDMALYFNKRSDIISAIYKGLFNGDVKKVYNLAPNDHLNVRTLPSPDASVQESWSILDNDNLVEVLSDCGNGWKKILINGTITGYVNGSYLH